MQLYPTAGNARPKFWGWGHPDVRLNLSAYPDLLRYLRERLQMPGEPVLPVPREGDFELPPPRLSQSLIAELRELLGNEAFAVERSERLYHAVGKSYRDLIRLRRRQELSYPDAVVFIEREEQLVLLFRWAERHGVALIPFGGGTSVVGGVEPHAANLRAVISVDLRRMNRLLSVDAESLIAEVEAGMTGPELEQRLNLLGFTLGHSPESFEYSTVGGWIATRSAGQFSTHYGKIEDMVESLWILTPRGPIETAHAPSSATGPDWNRVFAGSEGILGIITRARLRIRRLPPRRAFASFLLPDFATGTALARQLMQKGGKPSFLRFSEEEETELALASVRWGRHRAVRLGKQLAFYGFRRRGFPPGRRCLMLIGWEGDRRQLRAEKRLMRSLLRGTPHLTLGPFPSRFWFVKRFRNPYLRDELMNYGLLVETLETAAEWHHIPRLYREVRETIRETFARLGIPGVVTAHLSHLYVQGSSLYFIILARPHPGEELRAWREIKEAASEAIVSLGAPISHHHGVGMDHLEWFVRGPGRDTLPLLRSLKNTLDSSGILNPGKLLPPDEAGPA